MKFIYLTRVAMLNHIRPDSCLKLWDDLFRSPQLCPQYASIVVNEGFTIDIPKSRVKPIMNVFENSTLRKLS